MSKILMIAAILCFLWHFVFGDPMRKDGAHGWVPLVGFFSAIGALLL